ncbi:MAG: UDP-glucose 4-epimerase [Frankiales bacterium]|jgi:nucleoside-diphosphate-sugar epimerase|nr:UDP-glucose 4-epimerase [Frankiales bacterium]
MRVVVTGASGNVGTALLRALRQSARVTSIVGVARRPPPDSLGAEWLAADVAGDDLTEAFRGADAVVHLAWLIQPSHDQQLIHDVNVRGTRRMAESAARAGVPAFVHASSVGVYSPRTSAAPVDESYARDGVASSDYSRDKAQCEAFLDAFELRHPEMRVVRMRPGLIFQRSAGSEISRYFLGPFVPAALLRPRALPVLPVPRGLAVQALHADDVANAYLRAVLQPGARGAYNVAAAPVLDAQALAAAFGARARPLSPRLVRALAALTWQLHLQPTAGGWLDLGMSAPIMSTDRIRQELGWSETRSSADALRELVEGIRTRSGGGTPVMHRLPMLPARLMGRDRLHASG